MNVKDWRKLGAILNPTTTTHESTPTVAEYIAAHPEVKIERRVSRKGAELIKVFYPTGKVAEYPAQHIDTTTAFEY